MRIKRYHKRKPSLAYSRQRHRDPLSKGLVGRWLFNERGGSNTYDISRQGNTLSFSSAPVWTDTERGMALNFDGTDDYVETTGNTPYSSYKLTLAMWHNGTSIAAGDFASSSHGCFLYTTGSVVTGGVMSTFSNRVYNESTFVITGSEVHDGNWHHIALTVDDVGGKLYLDGVLKSSKAWVGTPTNYNQALNFRLGRQGYQSRYTNGFMEDCRMYNRCLSQKEIRQLVENSYKDLIPRTIWLPTSVAAPAAGQPTMRRWGGVPGMPLNRPSW